MTYQLTNRRSIHFVFLILSALGLVCPSKLPAADANLKHSTTSRFPTYTGLLMCGYQGWFRTPGDGSGSGWQHYSTRVKLDSNSLRVDLWPDVSEYPKTYPTVFKNGDGSVAKLFSSWDASTVEVHFRWMRDYNIAGVFMQRFFPVTRTADERRRALVILGHALRASQKYGRALAVMYDLSGLRAEGEDCSTIIQDWKELVDELKITSQGNDQTYLYHRGKPLVVIWGVGFPDRPYNIHRVGLEKLLDFLKNDPVYGHCSVMLGVPTYFRDLGADCVKDPYLHTLMSQADIILPWMVGRFSSPAPEEKQRYRKHVAADIVWCNDRKLDYAPCVYPGFSWHNLDRAEHHGHSPIDQTPRRQGRFYWGLLNGALEAKAQMLYVAMFDEIDEGTAIFKCAVKPPHVDLPAQLSGYDVPADHYLWLTGQAQRVLRGQIANSAEMPERK
jgi:hypothetical protein